MCSPTVSGYGDIYSNRYCCPYTRFQQSSGLAFVYSCNVFKTVVGLILSWPTFEIFHHCRQRCTEETARPYDFGFSSSKGRTIIFLEGRWGGGMRNIEKNCLQGLKRQNELFADVIG